MKTQAASAAIEPDTSLSAFESVWTVARAFYLEFARTAFDTYRPERHYMRGPGPACAAKSTMTSGG